MKIKSSLLIISSLFILSGCSNKTDKVMIGVDSQALTVKNKYADSKYYVKKSYTDLTHSIKDSFIQSDFINYFISDKKVLENRESLVIWKTGKNYSVDNIIRNYLKRNDKQVDVQGLTISQKMDILNDHFFEIEQNNYKKQFASKYPKPKLDKFKSDRDNIKALNQYKYQLNISKNEWELKLNDIKKVVASKMLLALYGKPVVKTITYDPNKENMFMTIESLKNSFTKKITFDVNSDIAKDMRKNKSVIYPLVYFNLDSDNLKMVGASIIYKKKHYLVDFTDKTYKYDSKLKLTSNGLDLKKLDIDYKVVSSNVQPPKWFYNLSKTDKVIGYGMGDTEQEAKNSALKEIAQYLEVDVKSNITTNKKRDGDNISSRTNQNIKVSTKNKKLKGTKTIKSQKKDGIWFIAVSY